MPRIASNVPCFLTAPGSLLHRADKDFEVGEYMIPKGAAVVAMTRGLMYDPKVSIDKTSCNSVMSIDLIPQEFTDTNLLI